MLLSLNVAAAGKTEVTWFGESAFRVTTPSGGVLLIDPWILGPHNPDAVSAYASLKRVDYLLITHGHTNAVGDALEIAQKTGARLVVATRLKTSLVKNIKFPVKQTFEQPLLDNWDSIELLDGEVKVTLVPARHLATGEDKNDAKMRNNAAYAGSYGFIIAVRDGPTLYHTGDTKLIDDFADIGKKMRIDAMLVCINDRSTMSPEDAAEAVRLVAPRMAIPMHFENKAGATGVPELFARELAHSAPNTKMHELKVGESVAF
jgi:L-ascorbate metabolism protein UlaG (beta-lactamase superfamily)